MLLLYMIALILYTVVVSFKIAFNLFASHSTNSPIIISELNKDITMNDTVLYV